jgi:hypothetical protein
VNPIEVDRLALGDGRQADYSHRNRMMALHSASLNNIARYLLLYTSIY